MRKLSHEPGASGATRSCKRQRPDLPGLQRELGPEDTLTSNFQPPAPGPSSPLREVSPQGDTGSWKGLKPLDRQGPGPGRPPGHAHPPSGPPQGPPAGPRFAPPPRPFRAPHPPAPVAPPRPPARPPGHAHPPSGPPRGPPAGPRFAPPRLFRVPDPEATVRPPRPPVRPSAAKHSLCCFPRLCPPETLAPGVLAAPPGAHPLPGGWAMVQRSRVHGDIGVPVTVTLSDRVAFVRPGQVPFLLRRT